MGESGYANSSWSASAGYSASMFTEDTKVDSSSTRQLLPSSVNISAEYPALPDHDSMNNPSVHNFKFSECTMYIICENAQSQIQEKAETDAFSFDQCAVLFSLSHFDMSVLMERNCKSKD